MDTKDPPANPIAVSNVVACQGSYLIFLNFEQIKPAGIVELKKKAPNATDDRMITAGVENGQDADMIFSAPSAIDNRKGVFW
jgi:hypothetical protein